MNPLNTNLTLQNDDSKYDGERVAISYYIDEEEDDLGDVMNKIKKRLEYKMKSSNSYLY